MANNGHRPAWDQKGAEALRGCSVLIGITRASAESLEQEQMFGVITSANARDGFEVALQGSRNGEVYWLPPDVRNFFPAQPGEYRLRSTGEVVVNPDFTTTWTINADQHQA